MEAREEDEMQIGEEDASQKDERDRKLWIKIKKEEDARLTGEAHDLHLSQPPTASSKMFFLLGLAPRTSIKLE